MFSPLGVRDFLKLFPMHGSFSGMGPPRGMQGFPGPVTGGGGGS